jgi:hypothetical protein
MLLESGDAGGLLRGQGLALGLEFRSFRAIEEELGDVLGFGVSRTRTAHAKLV